MSMRRAKAWAYYSDSSPFVCEWTRNLIRAGLIMDGDVDCRPIESLDPDDLLPYAQVHLFNGIAGWPYALRLAKWPDDRAVWTGSCPCGPFSVAGKRQGARDPRHLWPHFLRLISANHPPIVFGEQVAGPDGRKWLAGIHADLEEADYQFAAANLCAAGAGAPHVRQRYYWVANSHGEGSLPAAQTGIYSSQTETGPRDVESERFSGNSIRVADSNSERVRGPRPAEVIGAPEAVQGQDQKRERLRPDVGANGLPSRLADPNGGHGFWWDGSLQVGRNAIEGEVERGGRRYRAQWRIKPGLPILAHGVSNRVGKVCAYGNAIVPIVAAEFIRACIESMP